MKQSAVAAWLPPVCSFGYLRPLCKEVILHNIMHLIKRWMFVRGIGKLPREYARLKRGSVASAEFLIKHFGRHWQEVWLEYYFETRDKIRKAFNA
jgi:hypothetical protein